MLNLVTSSPDPHHSPEVRIGDREREQTVAHLGTAFAEGRLDLAEYDERVAAAYAAKTAGDLLPLTADLPRAAPRAAPATTGSDRGTAARPEGGPHQMHRPLRRGAAQVDRRMPGWLRGLWLTYAMAVSINVVIWLIIGVGNGGNFPYFWPIWVAGPWGVILLFRTFGDRLSGPSR